MKLLGLAGKTGSGKNFVAELLELRGWRSLDLDDVAHRSLDALSRTIGNRFGPGVLDGDSVNRRALGELVFSDPALLTALEDLTYPWIEDETRCWLAESPDISAVIHAINLHKTSLVDECDCIIWVRAPFCLRRKRVIKRENRPWKELRGRFRSQNGLNPKLFSQHAEIYSVRNSGNALSLNKALDRILSRL